MDYLRSGLNTLFGRHAAPLASEPFDLIGGYFPDANEIRLDFFFDATQVNEEINDLEASGEDLGDLRLWLSEGRFDFDARAELIFHGLDPPGSSILTLSDLLSAPGPQDLHTLEASGTLFVALPVASTESSQPTLYKDITSEDVFDPTRLHLTVDDLSDSMPSQNTDVVQVIYLDLDGASNLTYEGPITISGVEK